MVPASKPYRCIDGDPLPIVVPSCDPGIPDVMRTEPHCSDSGSGQGTGVSQPSFRSAVLVGLVALLVSRLAVLVGASVRAAQLVADANKAEQPRPRTATGYIFEVLTSWDGRWYLEIVRSGYPRAIPPNITYEQLEARAAFFPLYPLLVRVADVVLPGGDTIAALFVNLLLSVVAVVLVGLLARQWFDVVVARRAMVLFAVFPGSFVMSFAYSEALLIVLAAACLLALSHDRWLLAGLAAALATAARPNGIALVAACAVAALIALRTRREWTSLIAPLLAPVGFVAFQWFLLGHTGERAAWFRVQREAWREGTSFGATAVSNTFSFLTHPFASPTDALTAATIAALGVSIWAWYRCRLPGFATAYVVVVIALMLIPATVTARPRFLFTAFPLAIAVAAWWPRGERSDSWGFMLVASGAGLAGLTALYGVFGAIP